MLTDITDTANTPDIIAEVICVMHNMSPAGTGKVFLHLSTRRT